MKFKSGIIASGRGSIGGITLSSNSFGNFFRARSKPCLNLSQGSSDTKAVMGSLHGVWRGLSADYKLGWQAAADYLDGSSFARSKRYGTGLNYFVAFNSLMWLRRDPTLFRRAPPEWPHRGAPPILDLVACGINSGGGAEFTFYITVLDSPAATPTGGMLYLSTSKPLPRGTSIWPKSWDNTVFLPVDEFGAMPIESTQTSVCLFGLNYENAGAAKAQVVWDQGWFSQPTVFIRDLDPLP